MVVALSSQHMIRFYSSTDLKNWTKLSDFGPANAIGGVWECPDLFELPVDGGSPDRESVRSEDNDGWRKARNNKWVLVVNVNPGAVAGGSGAQYFVGNFDGKQFTADDIIDPTVPPPGTLFQNFEAVLPLQAWAGPRPGILWVRGRRLGTCQVKAGYPASLAISC